MKTSRVLLSLIIGVFALGCVLVARSQSEPPVTIQWTWQGGRLFEAYANARTIQLGLRSDGLVVWREVVSQTNSPAEKALAASSVIHRSGMAAPVMPPPPPTNAPSARR